MSDLKITLPASAPTDPPAVLSQRARSETAIAPSFQGGEARTGDAPADIGMSDVRGGQSLLGSSRGEAEALRDTDLAGASSPSSAPVKLSPSSVAAPPAQQRMSSGDEKGSTQPLPVLDGVDQTSVANGLARESQGIESPARQPSMRVSPTSGVTPPLHTRWKKGQPSPNPGGRPKITREETAKWLEEKASDGKTNARKAIESVGEVAQSAGRHSASALKTLHDILPSDDKEEKEKNNTFNIGSLNMAIVAAVTRAARGQLEQ